MTNSATVSDQGWAERVEVGKRQRSESRVWAARDNAPAGEPRLADAGLQQDGDLYLRQLEEDKIRLIEFDPIRP